MPNLSYPTSSELAAYLEGFGLTATTDTSAAAVDKWERDTGWSPYLGDGVDAAKSFVIPESPDGGYLPRWATRRMFLRGGLQSVTSMTIDGVELTESEDYGFIPRHGLLIEAPYTDIWLGSAGICGKTLVITGKWGKYLSLPASIKQLILQLGAKLAFPQVEFSSTNGVLSVQTLTSKFVFGSGGGASTFSRTADSWTKEYQQEVLKEKLIGMGE